MMRILTLLLLSLLFQKSHAQIKGKVLEWGTVDPVANVHIKTELETTKSDNRGDFILNDVVSEIHISREGFQDITVKIENNRSDITVYIHRETVEFDEVVVYGERLSAQEILKKTLTALPYNYINSNIPLEYEFNTSLYTVTNDTVFQFSKNIVLYNRKAKDNKTLAYDNWYFNDQHQLNGTEKINTDIKKNYSNSYYQLGNERVPFQNFINPNYGKWGTSYLSTFYKDDVLYYDIIIINNTPQNIKFNFAAGLLANNDTKERLKNLKLLSVTNFHINASDFSVASYQTLALSASTFQLSQLDSITDKITLANWIGNNLTNNDLYFIHQLKFDKQPSEKSYTLTYRSIRDNVFLWNVKSYYDKDLVFFEEYKYHSQPANINTKLLKIFDPNDYIYDSLKDAGFQ